MTFSHEAEPPCPDEMVRDMGDEGFFPLLSGELQVRIRSINDFIVPLYQKADESSGNAQKWHKRISKVAFIAVTIAAVIALIQISKLYQSELLLMAEMIAILLAVGSWVVEILVGFHTRWIIERHKAERYRFLKFRQVIDPYPADRFKSECRVVGNIHIRSPVERFVNWLVRNKQRNNGEDAFEPVSTWTETGGLSIDDYSFKSPASGDQFWELVRYYVCVRLRYQLAYYKKRACKMQDGRLS